MPDTDTFTKLVAPLPRQPHIPRHLRDPDPADAALDEWAQQQQQAWLTAQFPPKTTVYQSQAAAADRYAPRLPSIGVRRALRRFLP